MKTKHLNINFTSAQTLMFDATYSRLLNSGFTSNGYLTSGGNFKAVTTLYNDERSIFLKMPKGIAATAAAIAAAKKAAAKKAAAAAR